MRLLILATALVAFLIPAKGLAQLQCAPEYKPVERALLHTLKERLVWQGIDQRGNLRELWQSRDGAWTHLLRIATTGQTCVLDSGSGAVQFIWRPYAVEAAISRGGPS